MTRGFDVCVAGGGPAGSAMAHALARRGCSVVLLLRTRRGRDRLECLAPSVWPALATLGLHDPVAGARFPACALTRIRWSTPREERRGDPGSILVRRRELDAILRDAALAQGVTAFDDISATPQRDGPGWRIGGLRARLLVDAAGRGGAMPHHRLRLGLPLVGLGGRAGGPATGTGEMRLRALRDGWCWAATAGNGLWEVVLFLDANHCAALGREGRDATWRRLFEPGAACAGLVPEDRRPNACDASAWMTRDLTGPGLIRVGDAALARDPLSSQGVAAALRAVPAAVATVQAMLAGDGADAALAGYAAAYRRAAAEHASRLAAFYAAGAWRGTAFWQARTTAPRWLSGDVGAIPPAFPAGRGTTSSIPIGNERQAGP